MNITGIFENYSILCYIYAFMNATANMSKEKLKRKNMMWWKRVLFLEDNIILFAVFLFLD